MTSQAALVASAVVSMLCEYFGSSPEISPPTDLGGVDERAASSGVGRGWIHCLEVIIAGLLIGVRESC